MISLLLPELEAKVRRIERLFELADSQVQVSVLEMTSRPQVTHRSQRLLLGALHGTLTASVAQAQPHAAGVVRLAYVRSARDSLGKDFEMQADHLEWTERQVRSMMAQLQSGANALYLTATGAVSRHLVRNWIEGAAEMLPPKNTLTFRDHHGKSWTLQHYASAVVRTIVNTAIESGAQGAVGPVAYATEHA